MKITDYDEYSLISVLGTLHRVKVRDAVDGETYTDGDGSGPSQGASQIGIEDVFLEDNIMVEPASLANIRDMTATMHRKKSVRYIYT